MLSITGNWPAGTLPSPPNVATPPAWPFSASGTASCTAGNCAAGTRPCASSVGTPPGRPLSAAGINGGNWPGTIRPSAARVATPLGWAFSPAGMRSGNCTGVILPSAASVATPFGWPFSVSGTAGTGIGRWSTGTRPCSSSGATPPGADFCDSGTAGGGRCAAGTLPAASSGVTPPAAPFSAAGSAASALRWAAATETSTASTPARVLAKFSLAIVMASRSVSPVWSFGAWPTLMGLRICIEGSLIAGASPHNKKRLVCLGKAVTIQFQRH